MAVYGLVYVVADTMLHVACCIVSASCFSVAMLPWDVACLGHAACRAACSTWGVPSVASAVLLHFASCAWDAGIFTERRCGAHLQSNDGGGVLSISGGSATFESVAISNTSAAVRVAGGGRSGRRRIGAAVCSTVTVVW